MKKQIIVLAIGISLLFSNSAMAANVVGAGVSSGKTTVTNKGATANNQIKEKNSNEFKLPGWLWIGGNCYYFTSKTVTDWTGMTREIPTLFTNGITPDGNQVDEKGRWVVDGVVQTNDYGNVKYNMAEQYIGKSNEEIWSIMKPKLREAAYEYHGDRYNWFDEVTETTTFALNGPIMYRYTSDSKNYGFLGIALTDRWDNQVWNNAPFGETTYDLAFSGEVSQFQEKVLKIALGDNVGQELFDYIRKNADQNYGLGNTFPYNEDGTQKIQYFVDDEVGKWETDENGNKTGKRLDDGTHTGIWNSTVYYGKQPYIEKKTIGLGSGIDNLDWSSWKNRTTDYGKTFSIIPKGFENVNESIDIRYTWLIIYP